MRAIDVEAMKRSPTERFWESKPRHLVVLWPLWSDFTALPDRQELVANRLIVDGPNSTPVIVELSRVR
jgi:hypothetical protein